MRILSETSEKYKSSLEISIKDEEEGSHRNNLTNRLAKSRSGDLVKVFHVGTWVESCLISVALALGLLVLCLTQQTYNSNMFLFRSLLGDLHSFPANILPLALDPPNGSLTVRYPLIRRPYLIVHSLVYRLHIASPV